MNENFETVTGLENFIIFFVERWGRNIVYIIYYLKMNRLTQTQRGTDTRKKERKKEKKKERKNL